MDRFHEDILKMMAAQVIPVNNIGSSGNISNQSLYEEVCR